MYLASQATFHGLVLYFSPTAELPREEPQGGTLKPPSGGTNIHKWLTGRQQNKSATNKGLGNDITDCKTREMDDDLKL